MALNLCQSPFLYAGFRMGGIVHNLLSKYTSTFQHDVFLSNFTRSTTYLLHHSPKKSYQATKFRRDERQIVAYVRTHWYFRLLHPHLLGEPQLGLHYQIINERQARTRIFLTVMSYDLRSVVLSHHKLPRKQRNHGSLHLYVN